MNRVIFSFFLLCTAMYWDLAVNSGHFCCYKEGFCLGMKPAQRQEGGRQREGETGIPGYCSTTLIFSPVMWPDHFPLMFIHIDLGVCHWQPKNPGYSGYDFLMADVGSLATLIVTVGLKLRWMREAGVKDVTGGGSDKPVSSLIFFLIMLVL